MSRDRGLVVADLDGTLQAPHEPLTAGQVATLRRVIAQDTFVAIVSGASVESIHRRVCRVLGPAGHASMLFYAGNGTCCFRISGAGPEFLYDHAPRFIPLGRAAAAGIAGYCEASGFGRVELLPGHAARHGTVCMELAGTQLTLTLAGLEERRGDLVRGLRQVVEVASDGRPDVRPAGTRSVDICLADVDKRLAVSHLLEELPLLGRPSPWDVLIAGDSLWPGAPTAN